MIEAFKGGRDFHRETAEAFGVDRVKAKAINFGIAYRKGAYGFSKDWDVSEEEAQEVLNQYFEQFPEVKELMNETDQFLKEYKYVKTMTGRRRRFLTNEQGYFPNKSFREAFNFLVQGFSADMIRIAAIRCLNLIRRNPDWDLKMIFTVHDEIGFKVKEEYAGIACEAIKEAFENAVKLRVPVIAEVHSGNNYGECK
jgi:DNA polymerase-1